MHTNRSDNYSTLDKIRINDGIDKCKEIFEETFKKNKIKAVSLLNDQRLTFPSLYILMSQIESHNLYRYLNFRNLTALRITSQILKPQNSDNGIDYLSDKNRRIYSVLKWIIETGNSEDILNNEYEQIMDIIVSVLINLYQDKSILPYAADMIFKRNTHGRNIHNLAWAYFQIRDPEALKIIAKYILSSGKKEMELAYKLLGIEEEIKMGISSDRQSCYESYLDWLRENDPFLYFTGESFQFASKPKHCKIDLERKYMFKGIPSYDKTPIIPSDDRENKCLQIFKSLSNEEKTILSLYSYNVHNKDVLQWEKWIQSPIDEQIETAKSEMEGF